MGDLSKVKDLLSTLDELDTRWNVWSQYSRDTLVGILTKIREPQSVLSVQYLLYVEGLFEIMRGCLEEMQRNEELTRKGRPLVKL